MDLSVTCHLSLVICTDPISILSTHDVRNDQNVFKHRYLLCTKFKILHILMTLKHRMHTCSIYLAHIYYRNEETVRSSFVAMIHFLAIQGEEEKLIQRLCSYRRRRFITGTTILLGRMTRPAWYSTQRDQRWLHSSLWPLCSFPSLDELTWLAIQREPRGKQVQTSKYKCTTSTKNIGRQMRLLSSWP